MDNKKLTNVRIDPETWRKIKSGAALAGLSIGDYIKEIIDGVRKP